MPVLVLPLLTGLEIAAIIAALVAIALVLIQLPRLIAAFRPAPTPPSPDGRAAIQTLDGELRAIQESGTRPDAAKCAELRALLDRAQAGGVSQLRLAPMKTAVDTLCPGS